ncbi:MAG: hypothetical protein IPP34_06075 [Bacteroidetes bacterium]|nr:hypothetical protein [Bacteroidota bacterium]
MNSHTRIRIFTIIAFILIAGVLYIGYSRMQENTRSLLQTVDENARPAEDLLRIKELWISFNRTSTDIRSFAVTRDDNFLSGFLEMKDTLIAGIDSLKAKAVTSGRPIDDLLKLEAALDKKVSIYDSLLEINYNRVMISAIEKMKPDELEVDTASVILNEGNFFQRSFTRKYSRKALQAKVDSMILARSERISSFKQNLSKIREEEERLLAEQSQKELALLANDKKVTGEIERLIKKLEPDEQIRIKEKALESVKTAGDAAIAIRQILIAGLVVIFLLVILVLRDLEVAGKRRKELVEARLKAEKLARAKEEFMATMSHEIRTPLTSVIGFAAKLGETTLDPVQQRFMKAIAGSSEHLLSIVNDVLDFTRVDSGKLKFESVPFKVADIFVDVYDALVWKAEEKSIKLNLFIKPVETLLLHGDPVRLRQVLFNLVGNAIKFTHKGSVDITATF